MLADIVTIGGLIALVVTTSLLAWQTHAAVQQARIANAIAGATVLNNSSSALREIFSVFIERPELRAYFYDLMPCPQHGHDQARVLAIAEIFGDTLEDGLVSNRLVPTTESLDDWIAYCREMLTTSPTLITLVSQHPGWWPELNELRLALPRVP